MHSAAASSPPSITAQSTGLYSMSSSAPYCIDSYAEIGTLAPKVSRQGQLLKVADDCTTVCGDSISSSVYSAASCLW
eukprot:12466-Heterococcus_DN1.PRE.1